MCTHIDICHICTTVLNTEALIFFSLNVGNVGECCKAQRDFVDQRIAQQLVFLLFVRLVQKSVTKARRRRRGSSFLRQHCVKECGGGGGGGGGGGETTVYPGRSFSVTGSVHVRVLTAEKQRKIRDS